MKARIIKLVSLCTMTAIFLFSNIAPQKIEALGSNYEDTYSIESCADIIRGIYKEKYPESTAMIDDIVDSITSNSEFIYIFETEGTSAFQIVEDSLRDALDPEPMPIMTTDDLYTSKYSFPIVKQMNTYFCGPAATLMALIGSGASQYYYTSSKSLLNIWQNNLSKENMLNTTEKNGTNISKITKVLKENIPSAYGHTYKTKAFTQHTFNKALSFISESLIYDAVPVIKVSDTKLLKYYKGENCSHYMVVNYVDFNAETVMLYDPHYDDKYYGNHTISFDEFNYMAEKCTEDFWVSVYTKDSEDDPFKFS